jgi:hypothetical protein
MYQFAYDENFKISKEFLSNFNHNEAYSDLAQLITDFNQGQFDIIFIPVGALIDVTIDYKIIAQTRLNFPPQQVMTASLLSIKPIQINQIEGAKLGFINSYCTTSYWAPLIELKKILPSQSQLSLYPTENFENLKSFFLKKEFDLAMFWDKFLTPDASHPSIISNHQLPTPILIAKNSIDEKWLQHIYDFEEKNDKYFFHRFLKPDLKNINTFFQEMKSLKNYFKIDIHQNHNKDKGY